VVALIVGQEPGPLSLGSLVADMDRSEQGVAALRGLLEKNKVTLGPAPDIRVRQSAVVC